MIWQTRVPPLSFRVRQLELSRMIATRKRSWTMKQLLRTRRASTVLMVVLGRALLAPLILMMVGWWLTVPLASGSPVGRRPTLVAAVPARCVGAADSADATAQEPPQISFLAWPEGRVEGIAAKRLLLAVLLVDTKLLESIDGYTAIFPQAWRIGGKLGEEQTLEMKLRQRPFSVYLKFVNPEPGKEVVYAEGQNDNMVVAHATGWSRRLVPGVGCCLRVRWQSPRNRYPITTPESLA